MKIKPKPLISLDIHVDGVQLQQAYCELPKSIIVDGSIKEPDKLKSIIQHLIEKIGLKDSCVAMTLPAQAIVSRRIQLPSVLLDDECEIEIHAKLNHFFPDIKEKLFFDFININTDVTQSKNGNPREVLLVAARQKRVEEYINAVNQSGLRVREVGVEKMIGINLLPWRSLQKRKQNLLKIICGLAILTSLLVLIFFRFYFHSKKIEINTPPALQTKSKQHHIKKNEYKTIGYLLGDGSAFGLVKTTNGRTVTVQVGSMLASDVRVVHIDESGIVIKRNGHEERL